MDTLLVGDIHACLVQSHNQREEDLAITIDNCGLEDQTL